LRCRYSESCFTSYHISLPKTPGFIVHHETVCLHPLINELSALEDVTNWWSPYHHLNDNATITRISQQHATSKMPVQKPTILAAAQPTKTQFDPWNSSSTGHQRAENRLGASTGWRQSRATKLHHQFKSGGTGGKRISDKVGAGSEDWDEKAKALISKEVRQRAQVSVGDMLVGKGKSMFCA
jgi:hypothetical protein